MKTKVKDIAKAAGVSPSTVSLVLNNKPSRISDSTKEHIKNIARQLQYEDTQAGFFEKSGIKTIGLIIPDTTNMFFNTLAIGVTNYAYQQNFVVHQCNIADDAERCFSALESLLSMNVDGIIVVPPSKINSHNDNIKLKKYFNKVKLPAILLDRAVYTLFCDFVTSDNKYGGYIATEYLLKAGHNKIGCILGYEGNYTTRKRLEGYKEALAAYSLAVNDKFLFYGNFDIASGKQAAEKLINEGVTAIFAFNDQMALGVYQYAKENGIKIPEDLSVIGFDNTQICSMLDTPLTSIDQNAESMGMKAVEVLLRKISKIQEDEGPRNYYFTPFIVPRQSVKPLEI